MSERSLPLVFVLYKRLSLPKLLCDTTRCKRALFECVSHQISIQLIEWGTLLFVQLVYSWVFDFTLIEDGDSSVEPKV